MRPGTSPQYWITRADFTEFERASAPKDKRWTVYAPRSYIPPKDVFDKLLQYRRPEGGWSFGHVWWQGGPLASLGKDVRPGGPTWLPFALHTAS